MSDLKMKKSGIGAIHDNKIKDIDFAKLALQLNIQIRNLGKMVNLKLKKNLNLELMIILYYVNHMVYLLRLNGLALSTDYDRRSLYEIEQGNMKLPFMDTIKKAKDFICNYDAILAQSNKLNAAIYCFRSKNMYGMKDVQEIKATSDFTTDPQNPEEVVAALPDVDEKDFIEIKDE